MEKIRALFDKHVEGKKAFDESQVRFLEGDGSEYIRQGKWMVPVNTRIVYVHEGVKIDYYSRVTWQLDDHDRFTDYKVTVDGETMVNVKGE